ncbi:MAG TPA: BatD family protein [Chitinophagales bacterium]|nr:BatD family protein [Chitinophagales bacterium]
MKIISLKFPYIFYHKQFSCLNLNMGRSFLLFTISFLINYPSSSAQVKFYVSAPKSIPENQNFNLVYTIENANGSNLRLPLLSDFSLLGGPNSSTSMRIINGAVSQSASYTYVLRPKQQGTFKIGKATIVVNGNTIESNELTIEVTAPASQPQTQRSNPYNQPQQQEPQSDDDLIKQLKDDVFVKVILSRSSVYKGEMLSATYRLYFRHNLNGFNLSKAPALEGFWSKEADLDPKRKQTVETVNGKQYYAIDILKYNLYPQRSGTLQISSAEISTVAQVTLRSQSRDPFDDFFNNSFSDFFGQTKNVPLTLKTGVSTVVVKELPEDGRPADFTGAVGKFNFETALSAQESKTDDPVTYTIKISGNGNLSLIDAPAVQLPSGFEVYDPKVKENINNGVSGISGSKQYDYLIIPRLPGDYKIGGQAFSYFDPAEEKYVTINPPEFSLKITGEPSQNVNTGTSSYVTQQDVMQLGEDIRYIKTAVPAFDKNSKPFFGSAGFIALYAFPFLAFMGLIAIRRRNEKLAADITGTKKRRALKIAAKRLRFAEKNLSQGEKKKFYDEVSRALWGYLGDKLNIDMAELSKESVDEKLFARNVKPGTTVRLQQLINTCEVSLYAPSADATEMKMDYKTALNLIADLEDEIRS